MSQIFSFSLMQRAPSIVNTCIRRLKPALGSPIALGLGVSSFLALGLVRSGWVTWICFGVGVIICAIPGWFACKLLYGLEYAQRLDALGHIVFLGLLLTTFLSVAIAACGPGLTIPTMLAAALSSALLLFLLGQWMPYPVIGFQDNDPVATRAVITVGIVLILVIVAGPFLNVGRNVGDSYVYTPYFYRDFFRNVAVSAELAKGPIPPTNPFFEGVTLHYYWFQMVFPALVYRLSGLSADLEAIVLLSILLIDVTFIFIFVHFFKWFVRRTFALMIVLGLAFAAESYQAPFKVMLSLQPTYYAIDGTWLGAIALPPLGYFFQCLLYLPHHLATLAAFLIVISLLVGASVQNRVGSTLAAAAILFLASGFSFFIAAFGFLWAGSYLGLVLLENMYFLWKDRSSQQYKMALITIIVSGAIMIISGLAAYSILDHLQMLLEGGTAWQIYLSKFQLMYPVHFLVMLGPMLVLGVAGSVVNLRDKEMRRRHLGLLWLLFITFFFVMFLFPANVVSGRWEISQKLGLVLRLPLLVFSGIFLARLIERGMYRKCLWGILLFCFSATPNLLAYEYVHLNVSNSTLAVYVSAAEKKAAQWMRAETPPLAVVQSWPMGQVSTKLYSQEGGDAYPLIATFAERRGAIGDLRHAQLYIPRSMEPEMQARAAELTKLYTEPRQPNVLATLEKYQIDYLYWGISEKWCCLRNLSWYEESPLFEKVYDQNGISIFRFRKE